MTIEEHILANDVLREVSELLENQTAKGLAKYGTTVNPVGYTLEGWINHAQQECIDLLVYLTVMKMKLNESEHLRLIRENLRLRVALEFYADADWYELKHDGEIIILRDNGENARNVLETLEEAK